MYTDTERLRRATCMRIKNRLEQGWNPLRMTAGPVHGVAAAWRSGAAPEARRTASLHSQGKTELRTARERRRTTRPSVDTQTSDPLVGRLLDGRYRVGSRVARGGMATVYEALDTRLDRVVALKVMNGGLGDDTDFARKFVQEARAAARLSHPNVVAVFDQGADDGTPVPGDGVRARPDAARGDPGAGADVAGPGAGPARPDPVGTVRRARRRHRAPRHQARERADRDRRQGQGRRLRPVPRGQRRTATPPPRAC